MSGLFDNLDQASVFENSKWFQEGRYIVEITRCVFIKDGYKGDSFVIEARVLGAISTHAAAPTEGQLAAHIWNASGDKRDMARGTWMGFLTNVFQLEQSDRDGDWWKATSAQVLDDNYLGGSKLYLEVFEKPKKNQSDPNKPKMFTQHNWYSTPTAEQFAEFGIAA